MVKLLEKYVNAVKAIAIPISDRIIIAEGLSKSELIKDITERVVELLNEYIDLGEDIETQEDLNKAIVSEIKTINNKLENVGGDQDLQSVLDNGSIANINNKIKINSNNIKIGDWFEIIDNEYETGFSIRAKASEFSYTYGEIDITNNYIRISNNSSEMDSNISGNNEITIRDSLILISSRTGDSNHISAIFDTDGFIINGGTDDKYFIYNFPPITGQTNQIIKSKDDNGNLEWTDIKTINDKSILGDGNIDIDTVKNIRDNSDLKFWAGTPAHLSEISNRDDSVIYYVEED